MGYRVSHKLSAAAAVLAAVLTYAVPGQALDGVTFTVDQIKLEKTLAEKL